MKFLGRKKECGVLEHMYQRNDFQMLILYGRRRVGKTTLLNRFSEGKDPLFFTGIESKDEENLQEFGREVFAHFHEETPGVSFRSWSDLFSFLTSCLRKKSSKKKELIIIDEYPYIAENAEELSSLLQRAIDREWSRMNVMLVLCGSSITFMEEEVLGEKSPLYGRRTGQIDLLPFDYLTSAEFVPGYQPEEKALVYGMTGGIPKYLAMFRDDISVDQNIISLFFSPSGYFYEEPKNLLRQEFRDISLYYAMVNAIASGNCQVSEIAGKSGFDTPKVVQALKKLEAVRIVRKETPILNEKNKKLNQYVLQDGMFRFWFRFVSKGISMIERNYGESYYRAAVQPLLPQRWLYDRRDCHILL
jgi:AAA+ ATPase superfamily predicted ATPase